MNKQHLKTAAGKLFMYSAFFHFTMLVVQAIDERSIVPINYFNIIDIDYFVPDIIYGGLNHFLSAVLAVLVLYYFYTKESSKTK